MAYARREGTGLMPVSVIAGPVASKVIETLTGTAASARLAVFVPEPGAGPEQLILRIKAVAEKDETDHLVIQCGEERPVMAYASLFFANDGVSALAPNCRLTRVAFAIESSMLQGGLTCFVTEQLEFVSDIFIHATSDDQTSELARSIALTLNPAAQVTALTETAIRAWAENPTGSFDFEGALNGAGWRQLLEGSTLTSNQPRVAALPYRARRPFHPERFWNLLEHDLASVFRAKGFFWLATRMDDVGGLNVAGSEIHCSSAGKWWAARDDATRETEMPERTRKEWNEPFGDRRQSFAVMGLDIDPQILQGRLDACLLTDSEMVQGESNWTKLVDPFPSWSPPAHVPHEHHDECHHQHGEEHECCHH